MSRFNVGLDLGQASDYTALAILERLDPPRDVHAERYGIKTKPAKKMHHCRHLERFRLGTSYPDIAKSVKARMQTEPLRGQSSLIVDATGVGAPVVDMLRSYGLRPIAVNITGGDKAHRVIGGWRVPKRDLVGAVQVLLQTERLKFSEGMPEVPTLISEFMSFKVKITEHAHDTYGAWREGTHDDLVLAVALAAWWGDRGGGVLFA